MLGRCEGSLDTESVQTLIGKCLGKIVAGRELLRAKKVKQRTANFVRTRLGNRIDDTARATAEFSRITCCNYLKFAN